MVGKEGHGVDARMVSHTCITSRIRFALVSVNYYYYY